MSGCLGYTTHGYLHSSTWRTGEEACVERERASLVEWRREMVESTWSAALFWSRHDVDIR